MKIYWLVQQLDFIGGTEMVTTNIINSLADKYDITIISTAKVSKNYYNINPRVKIESLNVPMELCRADYYYKQYFNKFRLFKIIGLSFRLFNYYAFKIRKDRKYLKSITSQNDLIIASSADGYILSPKGRNVAYHFHFNARYFLSFSNILLRRIIRKPDYYVFLTDTTRKHILKKRKNIAYKDITYIYNPVRLNPELHLNYHNNKIVFLGRFLQQKDPILAVKVAKALKDKGFNFEIHFYGEGDYLKDMTTYSNKHHLNENVIFHPMSNNVQQVLHEADLLLVTSIFEGFSLVTVEANSQSVPVITSNWGDACTEIIHNGENGYIIESRNPEDYADKIIEVLSNQDEFKNLRKSSYQSSFRFPIDSIKKEWINLLDKIKEEIN